MKRFLFAISILFCSAIPAVPQSSVNLFYVATAVDSSGTESAFSNEAAATVTPTHNLVDLTWTASVSTVSGYNVYRSKVSGGPYTKINTALIPSTTFSDTFSFPAAPTSLKTTVP